MTATLVHTASVHEATFEALRARIAPDVTLRHVIKPNLLRAAQGGIDAALEARIARAVTSATGPVLCTCSTIGEAAERAGALRIDAPMMDAAADLVHTTGGAIMMVYCVDSTLAPSIALLDRALGRHETATKVHTLALTQFWPLFEAGQIDAFHAVIAAAVRDGLTQVSDLSCVVLAQASMAGAAPRLDDLGVRVLCSPELALRALLARA